MAEKIQLKVEGMSCGSCVKSIQTSVSTLAGVETVEVFLSTGLVEVAFDSSKTNVENISDKIESLGFDVSKTDLAP